MMIYKPADITVKMSIDAVDLSNLENKKLSLLNTHKELCIDSQLKLSFTHISMYSSAPWRPQVLKTACKK